MEMDLSCMFTFLLVRGLNYFSIPFVITIIMVLKHNLKQKKNNP